MGSGNKSIQVTAYDTLRFSWQENSQDIANNRTVVGWKVELISTDYGRINSTGGDPWSVTVNGTKYSGSCDVSIGNNTTKTLASGTTTVSHDGDGKKVFSYSFTVSFDGIYFSGVNIGVKSGSGSGTLTTIPRTSSFTIPGSAEAGVNIPVSITRAVSSFTHDVKIQFGSKSQTYSNIGTSVNVVVPLTWLEEIPDNPSGVLTVTVTTKSGSTVIGTAPAKTMSITVPASVVPTVSIKEITPVDQTWGLYIQDKSKVKIELSAAGAYGSTIKSYSIVGGGYTGTTNPYTTGVLKQEGEQEFICKVVDSRGRNAEVRTTITVTPYEPPKFEDLTVFRANAAGTADRAGVYAYVKASRAYSSCGGNNTSSMTVAYKAEGASSYGSAVSLEHEVGKVIGGSLAVNARYLVKITVSDHFTNVYQELVIETDQYRGVLGEEAAGILMYPPEGGKGVYMGDKLHLDEDTGIHIPDLRDVTPSPNMFGDQVLAAYFDQEVDGNWRTILHAKGWNSAYDAFQIAGPAAGQAATGYGRNLSWRCGRGGESFGSWKTIIDTDNIKNLRDVFPLITHANTTTSGFPGVYGDFASRQGNKVGVASGDNYYWGVDSTGAIWSGVQVNNATSITWRKVVPTSDGVTPIANGGTGTTNITQAKRNFGIYQGTYVFTRNGTTVQEISIASLTGSALTSMGNGCSVAITNGDWGANHEGLLAVSKKSSTVLRFFFETASSAAYRINVAVFNY